LTRSFSFNLVTEPWIPCLTQDGQTKELSLGETLARASEIREIVDSSPLVTAAIHRLLLAVLHRCLDGPRSDDDWRYLWARHYFDKSAVDGYLKKWRGRFDLFDAHLPFYQTPGLDISKAAPISKLTHELSAGNNPLLFDHSIDADPMPLTPAQAGRYLLALHAFAVGGLVSFQRGEERHRSADAAPLVKGAVILLTGANLFETLLLNMVNVDGGSSMPFEFDPARDRPAWEQDVPVTPSERHPDGYLDLLTWQSRRVLLVPERDGGSVVLRKVILMKGYQFPDGADLHAKETMVAFQKRDKAQRGQDPWPPVGFRPERALWRDSLVLLQKSTEKRQRPRTVDELANRDLSRQQPVTLCAFGISSDRAKVFLWRHERLPLPPAYLTDDALLAKLAEALKLGEEAAERVRAALRVMAEKALFPAGNPDQKRLRAFLDSLAAERPYWSALDVPFRRLMVDLPDAWTQDEERIPMRAWAKAVGEAARNAFESAARSLETSARGLRAVAEARGAFDAHLNNLLGEHIERQGEEETK
jgi:CRISPR system Cascade subunit CasA